MGSELNFTQKDHIQPLFINYGKDSFESIGDPKVIEKNANMVRLWETTFESIFPNTVIDKDKTNQIEELIKMKFNEPRIDAELSNFE